MIAAMVVPFGCRSIASTASCLEEDRAGAFVGAGFVAAAFCFDFGFDWPTWLALTEPFAPRADLRIVFVDLDFDFLVAIWLSLCERQHSALPLARAREVVRRGLKG